MNIKILLIEDDPIYQTVILNCLNKYYITCIDLVTSYNETVKILSKKKFDIVLIDVFIAGQKTGIALGKFIKEKYGIPFIYITSNLSQELLDVMKDTHPAAVISKPIEAESFISNIKLVINNSDEKEDNHICKNDRIFIKKNGIFDKLYLNDIIYVESDHIYLNIYTTDGKHEMVRGSLKEFLIRFSDQFLQINRSCVINVRHIDHFDKLSITVHNKILTIGKKFKERVYSNLVSF